MTDISIAIPAERTDFAYQHRWMGMAFIGISLLVVSLDNTILNNALASIASDLQASASQLQWIVDAYILVFAALLLTMGSVGDRFGRKSALQAGLVLFGIGSLACAMATDTNQLIAARAFLGIGGATILPATLSIISATFPREEQARAIAIWSAVFGLGIGLGPLIGGGLLTTFHWNSVFFVNIPVIIVALIGGAYYIGNSKDETAARADIVGVILSIIGLFALVYGIVEAGSVGWTEPNVLLAFTAAFVLLGAFIWWEMHYENAMLPMEFFRNMSFTGANVALTLVSFALVGATFLTAQFLQTVLGFTAFQAGLHIVPLAIMLMICAILSTRLVDRIGIKYTVAGGIMVCAIGLFLIGITSTTTTTSVTIVLTLVVFAIGIGTAISPATSSVMGSIPVDKAGVGSAMNDTTRQLGGALGVAVLGTVLNGTYRTGIEKLINTLTMLPEQARDAISQSIQGAHIVAHQPQVPPIMSNLIINTTNIAFIDGMRQALFVGTAVMVLAALVALVTLPHRIKTTSVH